MISRCTDQKIISDILLHPKVIDWVTDDCYIDNYVPEINDNIIYLVDDNKDGVIRVDPMNNISCIVHIAVKPKMWGSGHKFAENGMSWIFTKTKYSKIIGFIPTYNKFAIKLAEDLGFSQEGFIKRSYLKNWRLHDQVVFGISKGEWLCQQ